MGVPLRGGSLLDINDVSPRTCVHMVMLTCGGAGCGATRLTARCAGRSSAAVVPSHSSDSENTAPQTVSAASAAATARLRLRRRLCAPDERAALSARPASAAAASLVQCGPGSCAAAPSLKEATGLPRHWDG